MVRRNPSLGCDVGKQPTLIHKCAAHASLRRVVTKKMNHDAIAMARFFSRLLGNSGLRRPTTPTLRAFRLGLWNSLLNARVLQTRGNSAGDDYASQKSTTDRGRGSAIDCTRHGCGRRRFLCCAGPEDAPVPGTYRSLGTTFFIATVRQSYVPNSRNHASTARTTTAASAKTATSTRIASVSA